MRKRRGGGKQGEGERLRGLRKVRESLSVKYYDKSAEIYAHHYSVLQLRKDVRASPPFSVLHTFSVGGAIVLEILKSKVA